jgi:hypothetical protein
VYSDYNVAHCLSALCDCDVEAEVGYSLNVFCDVQCECDWDYLIDVYGLSRVVPSDAYVVG